MLCICFSESKSGVNAIARPLNPNAMHNIGKILAIIMDFIVAVPLIRESVAEHVHGDRAKVWSVRIDISRVRLDVAPATVQEVSACGPSPVSRMRVRNSARVDEGKAMLCGGQGRPEKWRRGGRRGHATGPFTSAVASPFNV